MLHTAQPKNIHRTNNASQLTRNIHNLYGNIDNKAPAQPSHKIENNLEHNLM